MANCIKWAGGKQKLYSTIQPLICQRLTTSEMYIEPFLGSGAIAFQLLRDNRLQDKTVVLSDACWRLINFYQTVRHAPHDLICALQSLPQDNITVDIYNNLRQRMNAITEATTEAASLFIWTNIVCYNGLYRENQSGGFNVPYGKKSSISIGSKIEAIRELHQVFGSHPNLHIVCLPYEQLYKEYKFLTNVFWYLDPPYEKSFQGYISIKWDSTSFWLLTKELLGKWIMSNSQAFSLLIDCPVHLYEIDITYNIRPHQSGTSKEILVTTV